jgi:hypothetical protein
MQISFQFTPTKDDYSETTIAYTVNTMGIVVANMFLIGVEIVLTSIALGMPDMASRWDWFFALIIPWIVPVVAVYAFFNPLTPIGASIRKQVADNPQLTPSTSWQLDEDQLALKTEFSDTKYAWSVFQKAIELEHHYLLVHTVNKRTFTFLPKRVFTTPQQEADFRTLVEKMLGPIQSGTAKKKPLAIINIVGLIVATAIAIRCSMLVIGIVTKSR